MMKLTTIQIRDLGRTVTGHTPPTKETKYYGNYMPFVKPTDIDKDTKYTYEPEQYYSEEAAEKYKSSLIPKGSTCVVCIGTIGEKMTMAHCDMFTNQSINSIIPSEDYDKDYVYYLLKYNLGKVKLLNKGTASGREFVSKSTFLEMNIRVYKDKHMQEKIGKILSYYDNLIENYHRQIKLLEEAAQRLYKEWFVDLHFPGHENVKVIDGVPEGWEKKKIKDVCETIGGGTPSTKERSYYEGGNIKWVTPTDITRSRSICLLDTEKKITEEGLNHSSAKMLPAGTILMTSRASVGYFGLFDCEVCTNQGFISCIPNNANIQFYLLYNLKNRVDEIRGKAGGSTYLEISKKVFRSFDIVLPTEDICCQFQSVIEHYIKSIRTLTNSISLLTESRDRLLPKLMSGEIEI